MKFKMNIFITISLLTGCASMQYEPVSENDRTITTIIEANGLKKEKIFNGTKIWIAENFKSAKQVIEYENKEDGTIIGNGVINYPCQGGMDCIVKADWKVPFTVRVDTKDEKFRLTFTNINLSWPASYNSGILSPAYNGPVHNKYDLDVIKPKLLNFGNEINQSLKGNSATSNW
ncbi:DUF4468 domain-containing protein [Vogesella indigofera]|uniref:DUF4468 domain-containing protein n=1 Tax=Vogesella indigofera TaxID=45465 RepID=UPI00234F18D8|nr:DUF4468 domain-containing protein [Vogesella indigofera]MDC7708381.1 DUF4468 domain-containing protein [Vogesella indigofera]